MTEMVKKQTGVQINMAMRKTAAKRPVKISSKIKPWLFLLPTILIIVFLDAQTFDPDAYVYPL